MITAFHPNFDTQLDRDELARAVALAGDQAARASRAAFRFVDAMQAMEAENLKLRETARVRGDTYRRRALALREQASGIRYEMRIKLQAARANFDVAYSVIHQLRQENHALRMWCKNPQEIIDLRKALETANFALMPGRTDDQRRAAWAYCKSFLETDPQP